MLTRKDQRNFAVSVNNVQVGTITEAEYVQIRKAVNRDPKVWARWVGGGISALFHRGGRLVYMVPMTAVWLLVMEALLLPDSFTQSLADIVANPSHATAAIATLTQYSCIGALVGLFTNVMLRADGKNNTFSAEIANRIRKAVGCPAEGSVLVYAVRQVESSGKDENVQVLR